MFETSLVKLAYQLSVAAGRASDAAVHKKISDIVKLHAKIGVGAAWIPVPGADIAALAANTWTMYVRINKTIGIPFSESYIKSIATGVGVNLLSNLPVLAVSSALKFIPGVGTLIGGAILSATIYGVTIACGVVYMKALATLLSQNTELTEVNLKAAVDAALKNKETIKQAYKEAKDDYKTAKESGELDELDETSIVGELDEEVKK